MYEPCDIRNVAKKINSGKRDVQNSENKFKTELGNLAFSWHGNASKAFVQGYSESGCEINRLYSGINNLEYGLTRLATEVYNTGSITNKSLQKKLLGTDWANEMTDRKLASKISRNISLLRSHGLIRKLPKQNKYALTEKGRKITSALNAALSASTEDLMAMVA